MDASWKGVNASLLAAMRALLPSAGETLLLRAALDKQRGAQAWTAWRVVYPLQETLANEHVGIKGLLPLLSSTLEQNGATVTPPDLSLLRMARYREQLRSERYQAILHQALSTLSTGGVQVILLKGAALANTVYPEPALRHCHDIDLLLQPSDVPQAVNLLLAKDFLRQTPAASVAQAGSSLRLDHSSGLPLLLHTRLLRNPGFEMPLDPAWQSAVTMPILPILATIPSMPEGLPCTMLAPEWELVHILGAVICAPSRSRVTWVCDAHYLITAYPTMDWERVGQIAGQSGLAMATFVLLAYLQEQHYLPVPSFVLDSLRRRGAAARRAEVEQLLQSVRQQRAVSYGDLFTAATSWQGRAWLLRWMLLPLPPPDQATGWQLPHFYLQRATRYLARKIISTKPSSK